MNLRLLLLVLAALITSNSNANSGVTEVAPNTGSQTIKLAPAGAWQGVVSVLNSKLLNEMIAEQGIRLKENHAIIGLTVRSSKERQSIIAVSIVREDRWEKVMSKGGVMEATSNHGFNATLVAPYLAVQVGGPNQLLTSDVVVNGTFTDATETKVMATLIFRGQVVAQGEIRGKSLYSLGN